MNRKFVYILSLIAAAGLLLGLILTSSPAKAAVTSKKNCWDGQSYNYSAWTGEASEIEITIGPDAPPHPEFTVERCRFDGIRIEIASADNRVEYKALREEAMSKGLSNTWLFCPTVKGQEAHMVYWLWHAKEIKPFKGEQKRYNAWAKDYGKKHGCRVNS